jgi:hypothetical protein
MSDADAIELIGWTVDTDPCDQCREVRYGIRLYYRLPDGDITSIWVCGTSPWAQDMMPRELVGAAS